MTEQTTGARPSRNPMVWLMIGLPLAAVGDRVRVTSFAASIGCCSSRTSGLPRSKSPVAGSTSTASSCRLNTADSLRFAAASSAPSSTVCTCAVRRTSSGMASLPPEATAM